MYVCVCGVCVFLEDHHNHLAVQELVTAHYYTCAKKKKKLFSRNGKKKPLQAELITSASPKYVNFIGKKSISYLLKPTLTRLLEQHH